MIENSFHMTEDRITVLVCLKCKKLIGTKENYYLIIKNGKRHTTCEGCYVKRNK